MKRLIQCGVGILALLLASGIVQGKLQLVENFESMVGESPDGQACTGVLGGTWDTQSEGTGNIDLVTQDGSRGVSVTGNSNGNGRALGFNGITNPIDNSETGILFFRFMFRASSRVTRSFMGLISDASDNPVNSDSTNNPTVVFAGISWTDNASGGLDILTTDGATILASGLVRAQWYNIWIVANNAADIFDLYISEAAGPAGEATLPTPEDLVGSSIPFGIATTDPLTGMIISHPSGASQAERVYVDDFYWDGDQGLGIPTKARNPNPTSGATDVSRDVILSWIPAPFAASHNVYLGMSFDDVHNADAGSPLLVGPSWTASTFDPGRLELDQSYYWRIDEVNAPPDSTVFKGSVWNFATEPIGYPIDGANITATASSAGGADFGPEKTVDGSGLDADDLHSTVATDMWLSSDEPQGAWVQYEFDKIDKLHEMWVWNSNQALEPFFGFGFKDVTVEYSTDATEWTALSDVPEFVRAPGIEGYAHDTLIDFDGAVAKYVRLIAASNWGGTVSQYGLSEVRFFSIPVSAREPSPDPGATEVDVEATLTWRAGREASTHNVYVSTNEQAVIDSSAPAVSVTDASYSLDLDLGQSYYWRIDEVNEAETPTVWQGEIWSFSTSQYLVVDDFESYNDIDPPDPESNRIFEWWSDGFQVATNGALIGYDPPQPSYLETTIVHSGTQSMPVFYGNTGGAAYSEASLTFAPGRDWTRYGIKRLSLWFYGVAGNTGQLYVKINGIKVSYSGDAANLAVESWQPWDVDLATVGVNLQSVASLAIGIDGNAAIGTLYFDDIRLY